MKHLALLLAATASLAVPVVLAAEPPRGPTEVRDGHLLAQPRLTLPAVAPWTMRPGAWSVQVSALWSNSFAWVQDEPGEVPEERTFLLDGETFTLDATIRYGLAPNLETALRVPLHARGGGSLDGFIDWWHRAVHAPSGNRPDFRRDAFRVNGRTTDGRAFSWDDQTGTGLGDVELETRWRFLDGYGRGPSAALVARVSFPTGTGPFAGNGFGGGGQLAVGGPLADSVDLYGGLGFTAQDKGPVRGIRYEPARAHAFVAVEWRPWRRFSLVAETNAASRLVDDIERYPALHWIANVTGRIDLGERVRLDLGFTENFLSQLSTTDFALYFGLGLRP